MAVICDGCRVRGAWEHRCHGRLAKVNDEPAGGPCECEECVELVPEKREAREVLETLPKHRGGW